MENQISTEFIIPNNTTKPLSTNKIALFDADYLKYIVVDRIWKLGNQDGNYPKAEETIKEVLSEILIKIHDPIIFCFSGKSSETFRYKVSFEKEYKGNRSTSSDSRFYDRKISDMYEVVDYISKNYNALIFNDLEADDILSALQCDRSYIISKDKDLKQVPGYHYNFEKNEIYEITNEEAIFNLCFQLLTGDTTDNITGIPGIGPVKAADILSDKNPKKMINAVILEFQKKYGLFNGTDFFTENWNLIKTRPNRGAYFQKKYESMYNLKNFLLAYLK